MKKISRFIPLIILLILIALASLAVYNSSTKQNIIKEEIVQSEELKRMRYLIKLPEFAVVDVFDDDKSLTIKDFRNNENRYSVVNFFASWCVTCLAEHDVLMRLGEEKSINFYGIAWHDYSENAIKFLQKYGNPFDKVGLDAKGLFNRIVGLKSVPETMVVDPRGYVILKIEGNIDENKMFQILNFIDKQSKRRR